MSNEKINIEINIEINAPDGYVVDTNYSDGRIVLSFSRATVLPTTVHELFPQPIDEVRFLHTNKETKRILVARALNKTYGYCGYYHAPGVYGYVPDRHGAITPSRDDDKFHTPELALHAYKHFKHCYL